MNILQITPELNAGGVERTTIEMAEALNANGHNAHIASAGGRMEKELAAAGGHLHRLPLASKNPVVWRQNRHALVNLIRDHNIDLVHARSRAPAYAAKWAADSCRVPFVTTYHGIYNAKSRLKRRYNAIMAAGDIIIANSEYTKAHIIKEHGTYSDKIVVIHRGVDMEFFDPARISKKEVKSLTTSWGAVPGMPVLLLPGRLTRWKGQLVAVDALKHLHDDGVSALLVLLGDDQGRLEYTQEIKDKADALGVGNALLFAAHTPSMPPAYLASDIVISASTDPEAFGRVAAEAQAMERLVVASNHGGALETVVDGQTGILFENKDARALARAISQLLALPKAERESKGKAARTRIGTLFSAQQLKTATLDVYKNVLARHNNT